jgi:hypothetical protein
MLLHTVKYSAMGIGGENEEHWKTIIPSKYLMSQKHEKIIN